MNELFVGIITGVLATLTTTGIFALWMRYTNSPTYRGKKIRILLKKARIMWIGPIGVGKTSLLNHLFSPDFYAKTPPPTHGLDVTKIPLFSKAKILVSEVLEDDLLRQFCPTIIVIQISIIEEEHKLWLGYLLDILLNVLIVYPEKLASLRRILIIIGNIDKVSEKITEQELSKISRIVDERLMPVFSSRPKQVVILPCSLIQNQRYHTRKIMNYLMSGAHLEPITHHPSK